MRITWLKHHKYITAVLVAFVTCAPALCQGSTGDSRSLETQSSSASEPQPTVSAPGRDGAPVSQASQDDRLPFMSDPDQSSGSAQPGSLGLFMRTMGALLLVIGLLVGSMWCLKRLRKTQFGKSTEGVDLAVLTTVGIGDRRSLLVVKFGEKTLLLGSTPHSVNVLSYAYPQPQSDAHFNETGIDYVTAVPQQDYDLTQYQGASFADQLDILDNGNDSGLQKDRPIGKWY